MHSENTVGQKQRMCPKNYRDAVYQSYKSRADTIVIPDGDGVTSATKDTGT